MNRLFKIFVALIFISATFLVKADLKIAILTDLHVSPGNLNETQLKNAVNEINGADYNIVIVSGDITNTGSNAELQNVKNILDEIKKPTYCIPGNHENNWSQSAGATYKKLWGDDRFVANIGDDIMIIGMNCGPFMKMGNGHMKREDLIWLDNTLKESKAKQIISVNHYPLNSDLDVSEEYIEILHKYPVIAHLCGHYHVFKYYKAGEIDCLINRALDMKNNDYGYTLIDVTRDSIIQYNKQLDKAPELKNKFAINANHNPYQINDNAVLNHPHIEKVFADNASVFTQIGVDKDNLYFGNSLGILKCIDKKSKELKWEYLTSVSLYSKPLITDKYVVMPSADCRLLWINKKDGKVLQTNEAEGPYVADGVVSGKYIYLGGYNTFTKWDIINKLPVWTINTANYCQAAPFVTDKDVTFGAWDTKLRNVDINSGEILWDWNEKNKSTFFSPGNVVPVTTKDRVFTVAPDRYMTSFDRKTGDIIWRNNSHKFRESMGHSADFKTIYAKTMDGEIVAVDANANEYNELWCVDTGIGYEHAPCTVIEHNGIVYAGSIKGEIAAIDKKKQKLMWVDKIGNSEVNGWTIDDKGDIYISLIEGTIWKIK